MGGCLVPIVGSNVVALFDDRQSAREAAALLRRAGFGTARLEPAGTGEQPAATGPGDAWSRAFHPWSWEIAGHQMIVDQTNGNPPGASPGDSSPRPYGNPPAAGQWLVIAGTDGSDTELERAIKIVKVHGGDV